MERYRLHASLKYQKLDSSPVSAGEGGSMKNQKKKLSKQQEDYINGVSWPPRCYTCTFCKREFRSAQALGGHMNVHRRDRAMLRQYSPPTDGQYTNLTLNLHHNPNPNPNPNSSSSTSYSTSLADKKWAASVDDITYDPFSLKVSEFRKPVEVGKPKLFERGRNVEDFSHYGEWNKAEKIIRLDMEISTVFTDSKEIDLELRLGYS